MLKNKVEAFTTKGSEDMILKLWPILLNANASNFKNNEMQIALFLLNTRSFSAVEECKSSTET